MKPALVDAEARLCRLPFARWKDSEGIDQPKMVEPAVRNARVIGVTEQIIDPIHAKSISNNDLGKDGFPD